MSVIFLFEPVLVYMQCPTMVINLLTQEFSSIASADKNLGARLGTGNYISKSGAVTSGRSTGEL